jgi:hypothetical protein
MQLLYAAAQHYVISRPMAISSTEALADQTPKHNTSASGSIVATAVATAADQALSDWMSPDGWVMVLGWAT